MYYLDGSGSDEITFVINSETSDGRGVSLNGRLMRQVKVFDVDFSGLGAQGGQSERRGIETDS